MLVTEERRLGAIRSAAAVIAAFIVIGWMFVLLLGISEVAPRS